MIIHLLLRKKILLHTLTLCKRACLVDAAPVKKKIGAPFQMHINSLISTKPERDIGKLLKGPVFQVLN